MHEQGGMRTKAICEVRALEERCALIHPYEESETDT
jgi:hypothetical protein